MRLKLISGIVAVVCGIVLYVFSGYITEQVARGRGQIYHAQQTVNFANNTIDNSSHVKGLGGLFTGSAQDQINAGTRKANYYDRLARNLKIGGFVLFIAGVVLLFLSRKKGKWT